MDKGVWDIAVNVAQILSAVGTCGAVVVSLWLASQGRRPRVRLVLDVRKPFYTSAIPSDGRLVVTNTGERNVVMLDVRWRMGRSGDVAPLVYGHYDDDNEKLPLTWSEVRPGVPQAFTIPYRYNVSNIVKLAGTPNTILDRQLRDLCVEIELSTGHVIRAKVPPHVTASMSRYSELENRAI